jgi:hypothetical protein|eukprot:COSAG06_NODE_11221_length_1542_cov_1.803881_2_plen_136_part_00
MVSRQLCGALALLVLLLVITLALDVLDLGGVQVAHTRAMGALWARRRQPASERGQQQSAEHSRPQANAELQQRLEALVPLVPPAAEPSTGGASPVELAQHALARLGDESGHGVALVREVQLPPAAPRCYPPRGLC